MNEPINIHDLSIAIATALGPEWSLDLNNNQVWATYLRHANDPSYALCLCISSSIKGALHINGSTPRTNHGTNGLRYNEREVSINVSLSKSPEKMAQDISRRLLPKYKEQYTRAKASVDASDAHETKRDTLRTAVEALTRTYNRAHPYGITIYVKSSFSATVNLDISGLSLIQVEALIATLSLVS